MPTTTSTDQPDYINPPAVWVPSTGEVFLAVDFLGYVQELAETGVHFERYSSVEMAVAVAHEWYDGTETGA